MLSYFSFRNILLIIPYWTDVSHETNIFLDFGFGSAIFGQTQIFPTFLDCNESCPDRTEFNFQIILQYDVSPFFSIPV